MSTKELIKSEVEDYAKFDIIRYAQVWEDAEILLEALEINEDDNDRILGFGNIVMKYFREIFKEADNVFLSKLENLFYDEDETITDNGDGNEFFNMIPKMFWGNSKFVEELGEYMYNIVNNAYSDDSDFQNSLDDEYNERLAEEKAEYDYDSQQEAAEQAYYDALDRLGL